MLNGIINFAGLAVGVTLAGALASYAPFPTHLIFVVLAVLSIIEIGTLILVPETAEKRTGAGRALQPHVEIPKQVAGAFARITPVNVAAWSLGGFYLSLMPSLIVQVTGIKVPFFGASAVALLMLAGATALVVLQNIEARKELLGGSLTLIAGVLVTLCGLYLANPVLMFAGSAVSGFGFGAAFSGTMRSLLPLASPTERAGVLSTFYLESYLAFAIPAVIAGFVSPVLGLNTTVYWYAGLVIVLTLISFVISISKAPSPSRQM
jgi:MFS family permease